MEFLFGALGAGGALLLFWGGFAAGWRGRLLCRRGKECAGESGGTSEREKRLMREEAEAFSTLMGYNADIAYGIAAPPETGTPGAYHFTDEEE